MISESRSIDNRPTISYEEPPPQLPVDGRGYLACRNCRRILNESQWYTQGCIECRTGPISRGDIMEYATARFTNFFGIIAPDQSWVSRLIGKQKCPNGIFADAVSDDDELNEDEDVDEENENDDEIENDVSQIELI